MKWTGWQPCGAGSWLNGPAVISSTTSSGAARLDMFAIGYDSRMKHQAGEGAPPTWSGWIDTLGTSEALFIATPAAYTVPGVYGVFGIGTDSALYENLWLDSLGAWGGWEKLGGICREVAAAFGDQLHLFVTGADNSVFHYSRKKKRMDLC